MRKQLHGWLVACATLVSMMSSSLAVAQGVPSPPPIMPPSIPALNTVNLMTAEGAAALGAKWKVMDVKIVDVPPMQGALPHYKSTYMIEPRAHTAKFDDSSWPVIEPKELATRRGGGGVAFLWYRTNITIPAKIGDFDTANSTAVLTALVDDYAEVWINGENPRRVGLPSPATIQGFNMPNRVVLGTSVKPGDTFEIAVFGINGPISLAPMNAVWFRQATVEFYR